MIEKSAAAAQSAPTRPPVRTTKAESISDRIERLNDAIARRAYELFERDGRVDGLDVEHWLEAEKDFLIPIQTNMEEKDSEFVVRAEVPGFTANDLEVNVEPRRVTITGKREFKQETKECSEESSNEIFRSLALPSDANASKVTATLKDGVLEVKIPKAETKKTIPVDSQTA
jgi:HSP20 family protein